jgi:hypothetical protein
MPASRVSSAGMPIRAAGESLSSASIVKPRANSAGLDREMLRKFQACPLLRGEHRRVAILRERGDLVLAQARGHRRLVAKRLREDAAEHRRHAQPGQLDDHRIDPRDRARMIGHELLVEFGPTAPHPIEVGRTGRKLSDSRHL